MNRSLLFFTLSIISSSLAMDKKLYPKEVWQRLFKQLEYKPQKQTLDYYLKEEPKHIHICCEALEYIIVACDNSFNPQEMDEHQILCHVASNIELKVTLIKKLIDGGCNTNQMCTILPYERDNFQASYLTRICERLSGDYGPDGNSKIPILLSDVQKINDLVIYSLRTGTSPNLPHKPREKKSHGCALLPIIALSIKDQKYENKPEHMKVILSLIMNIISYGGNLDDGGNHFESHLSHHVGAHPQLFKLFLSLGSDPYTMEYVTRLDGFHFESHAFENLRTLPLDELFEKVPNFIEKEDPLLKAALILYNKKTDIRGTLRKALKYYSSENQNILEIALNASFYRNNFEWFNLLYEATQEFNIDTKSLTTAQGITCNPEEMLKKSLNFYTTDPDSLPCKRIKFFREFCEKINKKSL